MKQIAMRLMRLAAVSVLSLCTVMPPAYANPPPPPPPHPPIPVPPIPPLPSPCVDIPNPVYEACKAEVKCLTGPVGGTYCAMDSMSFCNRVLDAKKNGQDLIKIAVGTAVCKAIAPQFDGAMYSALAQAATSCAVATAQQRPAVQKTFCDAIGSIANLCPGPKTINTCPWKN